MQRNGQRRATSVNTGLCIGLATVMCVSSAHAQKAPASAPSIAALRAGFADPPPAARLRCYWWWLNGNTDKATITHDLEEMKAKGFGGALLVDANGANQVGNLSVPEGPTFGSPAWVALYTHALAEADRLGLEITLNINSGWNLGGPDVTPEQASKLLTWSRTTVAGGKHLSLMLPQPEMKNGFYRQIAVLAYPLRHGAPLKADRSLRVRSAAAETGFSMPDAAYMLTPAEDRYPDTTHEAVQDISAHVDRVGRLAWDAPAGDWELLRIGYTDSDAKVSTSSGAWQGLALDHMSREAFATYWDQTVEPLLSAAKPFRSLKYLATDSWELGGTNWTATFADEFRKRRGYDPVPWLPAVAGRTIGSADATTRFLTDLRRTVADLIVANHYDVFAERAAQHGLGVQAESGGPHGAPIDALETFRHSAVPQTEFWSINGHRARDEERFFTKQAASAANIYGQHFVAAEGETSIGPQWSESLATDLKPSFDMAITDGMNRLVWHEFTSSPANTGLPGQEYFAGTHLNPKVTWWNAGGEFFRYLNRVQFMMQQGSAVNDVLYFYGDNVPSFVRLKSDDPARVLPGYDYDVTNEDALLHSIRIDGGKLNGPSGVQWRALVTPRSRRLSLAALERVERYADAGGTVIGLPPLSASGMVTPEAEARFAQIVKKMWAGCSDGSRRPYGKGELFCTQDGHAALTAMQLPPDVEATHGGMGTSFGARLDYIHRRAETTDIYFVRNGSNQAVDEDVVFRASGRKAQLWDGVSGEVRRAPQNGSGSPTDGRTTVPLRLPPFGSIFVVFADGDAAGVAKQPEQTRSVALKTTGPWSVSFQHGRGVPQRLIDVNELTSWTDWLQPGVRYFSGTATYRAALKAPPFSRGERVSLRFSDVREIARVRINGQDAGTVWAKPLTLRVDRWLKPGSNSIEIQVTNLWPNRIIGDLQPGAGERLTQTNITAYHQDSPLLPSGLIGGVEWVIEK